MRGLIDALQAAYANGIQQHTTAFSAYGWTLTRAAGGYNGVVFHAHSQKSRQRDLAVKITQRDIRTRAEREYAATGALSSVGHGEVCPQPLCLLHDMPELPGEIVISEWLSGEPMEHAPAPDDSAAWNAILDTLSLIHNLTPEDTPFKIQDAVMPVRHPADLLTVLDQRVQRLPADEQLGGITRSQLDAVLQRLYAVTPQQWLIAPRFTLIHGDCHPANMLRDTREGALKIRLVDWENAGWADAAYEIANLMSVWRCFDLPDEHRQRIFHLHSISVDDPHLIERAWLYARIINVHWLVMMTTFLITGGATRPDGVHRFPPEHYAHYQMRYYERALKWLKM